MTTKQMLLSVLILGTINTIALSDTLSEKTKFSFWRQHRSLPKKNEGLLEHLWSISSVRKTECSFNEDESITAKAVFPKDWNGSCHYCSLYLKDLKAVLSKKLAMSPEEFEGIFTSQQVMNDNSVIYANSGCSTITTFIKKAVDNPSNIENKIIDATKQEEIK